MVETLLNLAVKEDPLSARVLPGGVVESAELPLGGEEALHPHGTAGVDPARGDAHLRTQAQPVPVSKPLQRNKLIKYFLFYIFTA